MQAQDKAIGDPSSSYSKEFENDISDCVSILKRNQDCSLLTHIKETMSCNAFKLIEQNHHPDLPPRGILRNHVKEISQQQSTKCILQEAVQVNQYCSTEKSNKHVTFSEKDRLSRQPSHSLEYFELQKKVCGSYMANAEVVGKDSTNAETSRNEQNNEEEFFSRSLGSERRILDGMNPHLSESGLRDAVPNGPYYAYPSGFFCMPMEGHYDRPSIKVVKNSSNSTCRRLNQDYLETYNEASVAQDFTQSTAVNNNAHSFQFQTFPPRSPTELLHAFYSLPEENQTRSICGRRSLNGINEDFVGLPLNSQGELITLSSNANRDFNQLNLFPVRSYVEENPVVVVPSRLGISESRTDSKTNLDLGFHNINDHRFHDSGNTICKEDYQVQKSPGSEKSQSTMRLMGKEFIVGSRGFQELEDEHIWKDKQIIDDTSETSFCPSEFTIDRRSESMYDHPHFNSQTSSMYQGVFVGGKIEPVHKLYPSHYAGTFSEVHKSQSLLPEPFTSGYESHFYSLELPAQTAVNQEARRNVRPTAVQLRNKQNLPHSPISAIRFPFMYPDLEGHAKSSWSRRSPLNRAPSCFDVSEKGTQYLSNSQSQCSSLGRNHPHLMPRDSHRTDSSGFCLFNPMLSESASQSSISPASLAPTLLTQHTIMPRYPGVFPVSAVQKTHGNQKKIKARIKSRTGIRGLDNGNKCKGQLSAPSNVPLRPLKMPTFGFDEDSQCAKNPIAYASFEDSVQNIETAVESCSATTKTKFVIRGKYEADKDEQIISPCMDSYADTARIGSIKLTAGTKHILKACQRKDQTTTTGFTFSESENSPKIYRFSE
ncbi:hypothetical protein DH2020_022614 [Rehmannia glutinosa]|uniref:Uncharacterized protein n=1 Tax=Rehmannia glutinosa TaxID=99300 RepID=A0ABR0W3N1_REHGL